MERNDRRRTEERTERESCRRRSRTPSPKSDRKSKHRAASKKGKKKTTKEKHKRSRSTSSSSSVSSSSSSSSDDDRRSRKRSRNKKRRRTRSTSSSSSSSEPETKRKKRSKSKSKRRHKSKAKKAKKPKESEKNGTKDVEENGMQMFPCLDVISKKKTQKEEMIGPNPKMMQMHSMKPMTKDEWDQQQSIMRRVYDPETGRHRLIKGDGEVMEEIVTYEQHVEINKRATEGDAATFQAKLGLQKKTLFDRTKTSKK